MSSKFSSLVEQSKNNGLISHEKDKIDYETKQKECNYMRDFTLKNFLIHMKEKMITNEIEKNVHSSGNKNVPIDIVVNSEC